MSKNKDEKKDREIYRLTMINLDLRGQLRLFDKKHQEQLDKMEKRDTRDGL